MSECFFGQWPSQPEIADAMKRQLYGKMIIAEFTDDELKLIACEECNTPIETISRVLQHYRLLKSQLSATCYHRNVIPTWTFCKNGPWIFSKCPTLIL